MRVQKDRLKNGLSFWCAVYPAAFVVALIFVVLRLIGWIRVRGIEKFPRNQKSVLLVSNHPSLWEPVILGALFLPQCLIHPTRYIPWFTPDKRNYTDTWYWGMFKSRFISVPRGKCHEELRSLHELIKVLRSGGCAVLFAEGGRTSKGKKFLRSRSGKVMRELKQGVGRVVCRTSCTVVPVWVDGAEKILPVGTWFPRVWRGMTITVGESFQREPMRRPRRPDVESATGLISQCLLETAD